ncbi:fibrinogen-like protein 1 [Branchiostoma floridae]|uniref:Fibrinogen-like protein 1 n=2 Tax=Branchiostoma floridae TaxID=7739 RepID=A0A9J7LNQ9_BRAFL|nr:fibrinogen-like protein 1 [Branchiostoma floridae]
MVYHDGQRFSTRDRDNDRSGGHCAEQCSSGWWFNNCHFSNLNGVYHQGGPYNHTFRTGIEWYHWKGKSYSLKGVEMKVRPSDF